MKKTLIALAALAVVSAASAQSTVTIYGVVDMAVTANKDTSTLSTLPAGAAVVGASVDTDKVGIKQGVLSKSRIGFKGTEELGGGLKANFVMEFAVVPDEGTQTMANRLGTVGVSGNFGAVTIGRQYTPYHVVQAAMDLYGNIDAPGYVVANHNRNGGRNSNSVQYATPSIGGFSGLFQVGAGEAAVNGTESAVTGGAQAAGKNYGLAGVYAAGPLVAGAAYDVVTNPKVALSGFAGGTGSSTAFALGGFGASALGAADSVTVWAVGASYDFGVAKASLAYSSLKEDFTPVAAVDRADLTSKGYNVSIAAPMGAVTLLANLGRADLQTTGIDGDIKAYQLGANYSLSKRTTAYALYGSETLTSSGAIAVGEFKKTQTSVGVRHTF